MKALVLTWSGSKCKQDMIKKCNLLKFDVGLPWKVLGLESVSWVHSMVFIIVQMLVFVGCFSFNETIYFSFKVVYLFEMASSTACKHTDLVGVFKSKSFSLVWKGQRVFNLNLSSLLISTKVMTTWHLEIGNFFMDFLDYKPCSC